MVVWRHSQDIIHQFKQTQNAVLFAAGSCWEGVDFPGDMVSSLIIVRLPFPVPDPISEAEREQYPTLQDYIREVIIPDMQVKLRQGFGRAIRTETDTCVVSILDHRAAPEERYHRAVLETLPPLHIARKNRRCRRFHPDQEKPDYLCRKGEPPMNQKYLQGLSSNMESPNEAVFFEATPENITAFLMQHQWAQMSAIGTVDDRSFLTARMGLIDTCPDQAYLLQKLLPIYAKVQMGDIPVPKLKTVPQRNSPCRKNVPSRTGTICAGKDTAIRNIRIFSAEKALFGNVLDGRKNILGTTSALLLQRRKFGSAVSGLESRRSAAMGRSERKFGKIHCKGLCFY